LEAIRKAGLQEPGKKPVAPRTAVSKNAILLNLGLALLISALALVVYSGALRAGFIIDDRNLILENPVVTRNNSIADIFTRSFWPGAEVKSAFYRPLVTLTYFLDYKIYKDQAWGYHLTNLALHIFCSVLIFFLFSRLAADRFIGAVSGLLFAAHPAHTQSVIWIAGRTDVLAAFFCLSALYLYFWAEHKPVFWKVMALALSAAIFFLGLLAKEVSAVLPILLILSEFGRKRGFRHLLKPGQVLIYSGYFALIPLYLLIRSRILGFAVGYELIKPLDWYPAGQADVSRLATVFKIFFYYLKTTLYPVYLCFECNLSASPAWTDPFLIVSILSTLLVLSIGIAALVRSPLLGLGILWFYVSLLPVSNLFQIQDLAMQHFLYLPSAGFCLWAGWVFQKARTGLGENSRPGKLLIPGLLSSVLFLYSVTAFQRSDVYRDDTLLWLDTVSKAPLKHRPHLNLAKKFFQEGDQTSAIHHLKLAIRIDPADASSYHNLGLMYQKMGNPEEAIKAYQESVRLMPEDPAFHTDLGSVLEKSADPDRAIAEYQKALEIEPRFSRALNNLGALYALQGRCQEAGQIYSRVGNSASAYFTQNMKRNCSAEASGK